MNLEQLGKFNDDMYDSSDNVKMVMNVAVAAAVVTHASGDLTRCLVTLDKLSERCAINTRDLRPIVDKLRAVMGRTVSGTRLNTVFPIMAAFTIEDLKLLKDNERAFGNAYEVTRKICDEQGV